MLNVRRAGDHLYGKWQFTWLSLVMSLMASFGNVLFPRDVLDEIWDVIQSVLKGFLVPTLISVVKYTLNKEPPPLPTKRKIFKTQRQNQLATNICDVKLSDQNTDFYL